MLRSDDEEGVLDPGQRDRIVDRGGVFVVLVHGGKSLRWAVSSFGPRKVPRKNEVMKTGCCMYEARDRGKSPVGIGASSARGRQGDGRAGQHAGEKVGERRTAARALAG